MAATTQPPARDNQGNFPHSTALESIHLSPLPGALESTQLIGTASTESLIGHTMEDFLLSPMEESSVLPELREDLHALRA